MYIEVARHIEGRDFKFVVMGNSNVSAVKEIEEDNESSC